MEQYSKTKKYLYRIIVIFTLFICIGTFIKYFDDPPALSSSETSSHQSEIETNNVEIDTMYPNTILVQGPQGTIASNTIVFSWRGSDDNTPSDLLVYSYKLKGLSNEWSSWTNQTTMSYTNLPDGPYTFFVKAQDQAGNIDVSPLEEAFTIVTPEKPMNSTFFVYSTLKENILFQDSFFISKHHPWNITLSIPHDNILSIYLDITWDDDLTTPLFHWGKDQIIVSIHDNESTQQFHQVSNDEPIIFDHTFTPPRFLDTMQASSFENAQFQLKKMNKTSWANQPWSLQIQCSAGERRLLRWCRDKGNEVTIKLSYTYLDVQLQDHLNQPPTTTILEHPQSQHSRSTATFSWKGTDDTTPEQELQYSYKLLPFDVEWSAWSTDTDITFTQLQDVQYQFFVKARDQHHVEQTQPSTMTFTVYTPLPDEDESIEQQPMSRFATQVIDFNPGVGATAQTQRVLGGPQGLGFYQGSLDTISLGVNGSITLGFDVTLKDEEGDDFIVFENPFTFVGEDTMVFGELVFIEVSTDGVHFARFPTECTTEQPVPSYAGFQIDNATYFAGIHPVYANVETNNINPFISEEAGGDAFDLQLLTNHPLVESGLVNLQDIHYLRLIDIHGDGSLLDSQGHPIYDPTGGMINGADIDAVAIIHYET